MKAFYRQLLENVRATPGVKSAGFAMVSGAERRRVGFHHVAWKATSQGRRGHAGVHERRLARLLEDDGRPLLEGRDFDDQRDAGKKSRWRS